MYQTTRRHISGDCNLNITAVWTPGWVRAQRPGAQMPVSARRL
jgi:hypothetical protein